MTESNEESLSTIKKTKGRSLGVKRTIKKHLKESTLTIKTPLSEKINLENNARLVPSTSSLLTPTTILPRSSIGKTSKSTGCQRFCLSLSKKFRSNYCKKRLQFSGNPKDLLSTTDNIIIPESKSVDTTDKATSFSDDKAHQDPSIALDEKVNIIEEIRRKENILNSLKEDFKRTEDIKKSIDIWKTAFNESLNELSELMGEEKDDILRMLKIPEHVVNLM